MYELLEILKYTVPSLIVLLAAWLTMKKFLDFNTKQLVVMQQNYELEKQKLETESKRKREESFIPLKLQAYERLALFLERINPPSLVTRELQAGVNAGQYHLQLLNSIKDEFEHNMSQQIYLSDEAWSNIKAAKEIIMSLVNNVAGQTESLASSVKLAEGLLAYTFEEGDNPIDNALASLKNDIRTQFS